MGKRKLTDEDIADMQEMRHGGASIRKLAYYFGVSRATVRYHTEPEVKDKMRERAKVRQQQLRRESK